MKRLSQSLFLLALALLSASAACTTTAPTNNTAATNAPNSNAGTPNANASPSASPAPTENEEANLPVTLPVLDAMFSDSSFAGALKAKLQLTDEQVNKLRQVAREETAKLNETSAESGTTSEATKSATEKIKGIVGADKTPAFMAFVRERWGGGDGVLSSKPNSVPTDTRIVINAPAFRMDVYKDGQLVKTYKVGIGYPEFPLPQGMRKADQIIFNPSWTPPDEPWVKGKVQPGQVIKPGSGQNPLGPLKIPIGLPSLIHGGKRPSRIGEFASHGCVGLTDSMAQDFALQLADASGTQLTPEEVQSYAKNRSRTQVVKLATPVPVELRYETIVVEDGKLHVYRDVYDKGTNTEENLRRVLEVYGVKLEDLSQQEREQVTQALQEMARDAHGNPSRDAGSPPKGKGKSGNVTYNVKGQKEVVIDIAALHGKGYPAPVNPSPAPTPSPTPKPEKAATKKAK